MNKRFIQFVYFDIGGVVILDYSKTNKWNEMLDDLGLSGECREVFERMFIDEWEEKICDGLNIDFFVAKVQEVIDLELPADYSMLMDFVNRFENNTEIAPLISQIQAKYRTGLLTNMYPGMLNAIRERGLLPAVEWEIVIDSSIEGVSKPNEQIFKIAEQRAGVQPESILFIENSQRHVETAQRRGWQTLLYDTAEIESSNARLKQLCL